MNPNKIYWQNFYIKFDPGRIPSAFAEYVAYYIKDRLKREGGKLLEIGCGNGRDSYFFHELGFDVTAIDPNGILHKTPFHFIPAEFLYIDFRKFDFIYLRFVVHTLTEEELNLLLNKIAECQTRTIIFIETRSTRNIFNLDKAETYFKSSIGETHFRMLYSKEYLERKVSNQLKILTSTESDNYAIYKTENPYCIRIVGEVL